MARILFELDQMDEKTWLKRKGLEYVDGVLHAGEHSVLDLASKFGTPLYLINEEVIRARYRALVSELEKGYGKVGVHFAMKANSNLAVLGILRSEGAGLDCVSPGEVYLGLKAGFDPGTILYTGNYFSDSELEYAFEKGVMVNLDAISHIKRLAKISRNANRDLPLVSFRVNPEFGAGHHEHVFTAGKDVKFGILDDQIVEAYQLALDTGFTRFGVHMHIGSGILDVSKFQRAAEKYLSIIGDLRGKLGIKFEFVDFGGGLGIPYHMGEDPLPLDEYAGLLTGIFKDKAREYDLGEPKLLVEPGRYLVCEAGYLVVRVTTVKPTSSRTFVGVDAGFNVLVRPTMYGSWHEVVPAKQSPGREGVKVDVVGQICESGDVLGRDRSMPLPAEGDYLAILDAGAYGFSMSSEYNSRPRPPEVLIKGGDSWVVRRGEELADLDRLQEVPPHLKLEHELPKE
ncbi:MAG: diaminopimelate decarboxylase [Promethearchaeota archaeon]